MAVTGKLFYKDTTYASTPVILFDADGTDAKTDLLQAVHPSVGGGVEIVACGDLDYAYQDLVNVSESRCRVASFYFTKFDYGPEGFTYEVSGARGDPDYGTAESASVVIRAGGAVYEEDTVSPGRVRDYEVAPGGSWFDSVKAGAKESFEKVIGEADPGESVTAVLYKPECHAAQAIVKHDGSLQRSVAQGEAYVQFSGACGEASRESSYGGSPEVVSLCAVMYPWSARADVCASSIMLFPAVNGGASITFPAKISVAYDAKYTLGPGEFTKVCECLVSCDTVSCDTKYTYEYQSETKTGCGREIVITTPVEAYRLDSWCNNIDGIKCWTFVKDNSIVTAGGAVKITVPADGSEYVEKETTLTITVPESRVVALVPCMSSIYDAMREELCVWGSGGCGSRVTLVRKYVESESVLGGVVCEETDTYCNLGEMDLHAYLRVAVDFYAASP